MKASDFIVMSDIDGTLIHLDGTVPQRNLEAIARFQSHGGRFGIATGRSPTWTKSFASSIGVNVPCVCFNGGALYDYDTSEYLLETYVPDAAKEYVETLRGITFPAGVIVMTKDDYWNISDESELVDSLLRLRQSRHADPVPWQSVTEPWCKLLLVLPDGRYEDCMDFLRGHEFPGVRFTVTTYTLVEMLPEMVTKAYALETLLEHEGIGRERLACVGDFYNDVEMLRLAGIGASTAAAPEDVKAAADIVVGPYENGAVADLIEHLERTYGY